MALLEQIEHYIPFNEQEARDRQFIAAALKRHGDIFTRENEVLHMTASAWTVNKARDKALMVYHNIYQSWSWLGGHADGEADLLAVALREVREESGVRTLRPVTEEIFSLEVLTVDGHWKRGQYVSSHLHLNLTYLLEADEAEALTVLEAENSAVRWFPLEEAVQASSEPWFQTNIYPKLNEKLRQFPSAALR